VSRHTHGAAGLILAIFAAALCCGVPLLIPILTAFSLAGIAAWLGWAPIAAVVVFVVMAGYWFLSPFSHQGPSQHQMNGPNEMTADCCAPHGEGTHYDLVILGSGSTAFAAALTAQEMGKTAVMVEERTIGGTCVSRGCLPSKNLIEAAKLVFDARNPRYPGLETHGLGLKVDFAALVAQKDEVIGAYRDKKYDSLLGGQFGVEKGTARFLDVHTVEVGNKRLSGESFLIATGSRPVIPEIPGLADVPFLTSDLLTHDEAMELKVLPASLLIIGGGYIALELGQMFARFGSDVTILDRNPQLLAHGYEPEVGRAIGSIFAGEGIVVVTDAAIDRVRLEGTEIIADVRVGKSRRTFRAERILVATGRRPNTDAIGIETTGVIVNARGEVEVDTNLRSRVPHIFAAGDTIGRQHESQMATPVGARQGGIAAHNALNGNNLRAFDGRVIPRAIFTDPPIGIVGITEAEVIGSGRRCWCTTLPMETVPRAGAIRDTRGLIKMVADAETNEVLGVSMVGAAASEVIHEAAMAMRFRATTEDMVDLLHVYPTMAEALKIAAIARTKDPRKLSCCAE
jgi:mercuric reductase